MSISFTSLVTRNHESACVCGTALGKSLLGKVIHESSQQSLPPHSIATVDQWLPWICLCTYGILHTIIVFSTV